MLPTEDKVVGVSNIIHALGIVLVLLSLFLWPMSRISQTKTSATTAETLGKVTALGLITVFSLLWAASLWAREKTILEKDSFYHRIRVQEDKEARYLYFDRTLQSAMNLADPTELRLLYSRYMSLGLVFAADTKKILLIGLGGVEYRNRYWQSTD